MNTACQLAGERNVAVDIPALHGTVDIVTGANSGIGLGVSERLAAAGAWVILAVRNRDRGEQAAQAIVRGWERGQFELHFPKRFTGVLKLMRCLPYRWYFPLVHRFTGL